MRNKKVTLMHEPDQGVHLFVHTPSRLEFAIESHYSPEFLEDCIPFPDRKDCDEIHHPNHLTVLEDFKIATTFNRERFVFRLQCPSQMSRMLEFIKTHTCFENPEIVVTHDFFNHIYGIKQ